jgi:ElaB/YqjD/DUF883 family membrane-anchored ribosome-binding protein
MASNKGVLMTDTTSEAQVVHSNAAALPDEEFFKYYVSAEEGGRLLGVSAVHAGRMADEYSWHVQFKTHDKRRRKFILKANIDEFKKNNPKYSLHEEGVPALLDPEDMPSAGEVAELNQARTFITAYQHKITELNQTIEKGRGELLKSEKFGTKYKTIAICAGVGFVLAIFVGSAIWFTQKNEISRKEDTVRQTQQLLGQANDKMSAMSAEFARIVDEFRKNEVTTNGTTNQ